MLTVIGEALRSTFALELNVITITSESGRLPEAFNAYRIAHVSDLHNTKFGNDNTRCFIC